MPRNMSLHFIAMLAFSAPFGYASSPDGILYSDWDGAETCKPLSFAQPTTEAAIVEEIVAAAAEGSMIKVVGAGHSFSGIQLTDGSVNAGSSGRMISLDRYAGVVGAPAWADDGSYASVTVRAGSRLSDLNTALEALGLAFVNLGSCAAQSIAGAVATGTHGTGKLLGSMSTQVVGLRLLDASGAAHDISAESEAELFSAARVGLGALGVVVEVTVRCVPLFKMKETTYSLPLADLLATHDELYENNDRFQWNWLPYSGTAGVILREPTNEPVTTGCGSWATSAEFQAHRAAKIAGLSPQERARFDYDGFLPTSSNISGKGDAADNSTCVDISYKTLVDSPAAYEARTLYTEMEMFIPVENTVAAVTDFLAFQDSVRSQLPPGAENLLYNQVRYVAADNIPLSPTRGADVAVLSMIVMGNKNHTAPQELFALFAQGMENITASSYGGVPHWGKKNWATGANLKATYGNSAWSAFETQRVAVDPQAFFLNQYLRDRGVGSSSQ